LPLQIIEDGMEGYEVAVDIGDDSDAHTTIVRGTCRCRLHIPFAG
jgi:hypothetical protein